MTKKELDHLLPILRSSSSLHGGKGKGGADLLLVRGEPEPRENFDPAFADAMIEAGMCVVCDADGRTEDGKVHELARERKKAQSFAALAEAEDTAVPVDPAINPVAEIVVKVESPKQP